MMPGQNDSMSALLGSSVQIQGLWIQGLCVDGLDSGRLNWGHQLPVSELSPALPSTAGLRIIQTYRDLIWSYGRDALWEISRWFSTMNSILQPICTALGRMNVPLSHISLLPSWRKAQEPVRVHVLTDPIPVLQCNSQDPVPPPRRIFLH